MLDVARTEGLIQVRTDQLCFALQLDSLAMELQDSEGRVALSGFLPRVVTSRGVLLAQKVVADAYGEIRTRIGVATRVQIRAQVGADLELSLAVDCAERWSGVILELALENRGTSPVCVVSLDPCWWHGGAGGRLVLPHEPGSTWAFGMGFQSHSRSGFAPLFGRGATAGERAQDEPWAGPVTPAPERNRFVSDFATTLCAPDRGGLTVGFLTHERFFNHVALRSDGSQIRELLACVPVESRELAPRSTLRGERLWLGVDRPGSDGIATWAEQTALEMGVQARPGATLAWSSRNAQLADRGVFALREAVSALRDLDAGVELIEIEQGYESQLGDWLAPSDGFPEGIAPTCRELERTGFPTGIWMAPFVASVESELIRKHGGWRLCEPDGTPSPPFRLPGLATPCVALDPSHPELRDWLAEVTRTLHGAGVRRLRLDWLVTGARSIPRPSGETTVEAYRGALRAMRDAAPETPWLAASRAPIGPSIGLVDAMRCGPELDTPWRAQGGWLRRGDSAAPGAERAVCNALARAPLGRLWQIDPDCLQLGETDNPLGADELLTAAAVALLCGGLVSFSGTIRDFSAARCQLLRRLLPSLRRTPEIGAPVRGSEARLCTRFPDGSLLVLLPNLGSSARSFELDLAELGLKGPHHLWDALAAAPLGVILDRWKSQRVPPRASLLLRFSPDDGRPRVIGSSLHLGAGSIEVGRLRSEPDGSIALQLRQPGRRSGRVALVTGRGATATVGVTFDHQLELRVSSSAPAQDGARAAES